MTSFDEIRLEEGQVLFKAGEPADKLYFIQSGSIRMADKNTGAVFEAMMLQQNMQNALRTKV